MHLTSSPQQQPLGWVILDSASKMTRYVVMSAARHVLWSLSDVSSRKDKVLTHEHIDTVPGRPQATAASQIRA